jgi:hypothetical protein
MERMSLMAAFFTAVLIFFYFWSANTGIPPEVFHAMRPGNLDGINYSYNGNPVADSIHITQNGHQALLLLNRTFKSVAEQVVKRKFNRIEKNTRDSFTISVYPVSETRQAGNHIRLAIWLRSTISGITREKLITVSGAISVQEAGYNLYEADAEDLNDLLLHFVYQANAFIDEGITPRYEFVGK